VKTIAFTAQSYENKNEYPNFGKLSGKIRCVDLIFGKCSSQNALFRVRFLPYCHSAESALLPRGRNGVTAGV